MDFGNEPIDMPNNIEDLTIEAGNEVLNPLAPEAAALIISLGAFCCLKKAKVLISDSSNKYIPTADSWSNGFMTLGSYRNLAVGLNHVSGIL